MYLRLSLCVTVSAFLCTLCLSVSLSLSLSLTQGEGGDVQKLSTSSYCKYPLLVSMIVNCVCVCVVWELCVFWEDFTKQLVSVFNNYQTIPLPLCVYVCGCILYSYCLFHCVHHVYALGYYYDSTKYQQFVDYLCVCMCVF